MGGVEAELGSDRVCWEGWFETRAIVRVEVGGRRRDTKKVLIVEDEQDVADLVADVLGLEGFEARVTSGESALPDALKFHPDVVLLDLMMPVVDGFEVARRFNANQETQNLPIIVMTAMHDAASRAAEIGTTHWLAKPFDIGELIETVEQATSEGALSSEP